MFKKGGMRPFFVGLSATLSRDIVFGGIYALLRHELHEKAVEYKINNNNNINTINTNTTTNNKINNNNNNNANNISSTSSTSTISNFNPNHDLTSSNSNNNSSSNSNNNNKTAKAATNDTTTSNNNNSNSNSNNKTAKATTNDTTTTSNNKYTSNNNNNFNNNNNNSENAMHSTNIYLYSSDNTIISERRRIESTRFLINMFSACTATILSSPFNYVRNIHYATPPDVQPQSFKYILYDLIHQANLKEITKYNQLKFVITRLRIGWGTARVGVGMAFGSEFYYFCSQFMDTKQ